MDDTATAKPKAYSYLRFSTAEQGKGDSHRRQLALAEEYCRQRGLELDRATSFQDLGVSAFSGKNRRKGGALRAFLDAVEEEIIPSGSYLLVESLDRVSREAILDAQATFLQIVNAGIVLVTLKGTPKEYSRAAVNANPMDLLVSLLEMIRANEESETKSQRIKEDWTRKRIRAAAGEAITSLVPAWLRRSEKGFEVIADRADVVRRIYELTLQGLGQHAITAMFNKEGIKPFGRAKWWHRSYVRLVLHHPAVIGTFVPHRMVGGRRMPLDPIVNYFPAVIDVDAYEAVRALDSSTAGPTKVIASMFSGLVKCEECGGPMVRTRKGQAPKPFYHVFVCQNAKLGQSCECRTVRQDTLEDMLRDQVSRFIREAPTHDEDLTAELSQIEEHISVTQEQVQVLVEAISQRALPQLIDRLGLLDASLIELTARKGELEAVIRDTARPVVMKRLSDLASLLEKDADDVRPRAQVVLRQVLERVIIHFDRAASRRRPRGNLEFVWKGGGSSSLDWGPMFYPIKPARPSSARSRVLPPLRQ